MSEDTDRVAVTVGEWPDDADSDEGVVVNWFAREGAGVSEGESLCEIQIEKVSLDVYAPADGTLDEIARGEDDEFERGDTLAWVTPA
ncbi:lipoyl domain-containing protein [Haloarcula onubensis]|uniref:Lipoyl domain-containing protein n=1 Tax=Haloarcula onubensis TaxID=2950539 RepID=A0ABU2FJX5_9EURY|nr:lipoyl domain-containing protein [Halomicroarcula sp. S3CR25-11]MDS0281065.1 lipoyl domain-containing protein [Halomicroarcula sp. S3CR25-11]